MVVVTAPSREPNPGTALLGEKYSLRSRAVPTDDGAGVGRWIAIDESGHDGDQLHGRGRYLVLGSVAIDDVEAADIVAGLLRRAGIQAPELKFQTSFARDGFVRRRALLAELLAPGGPLVDRASVFVVDKHYFVAAKLVDLLIEERCHAVGLDIVSNGMCRQYARDLANEGSRALGSDGFDRLLSTSAMFFSKQNRTGDKVSVDELFDVIGRACATARRSKAPQALKATGVLEMLRLTRREAEEFLRSQGADFGDSPVSVLQHDALEPLITCVPTVISIASLRYGKVSTLADDQKLFTDAKLDLVERGIPAVTWLQGVDADDLLGGLVRGNSREHPSLQLADLVSGAGLAVARRHDGELSPAGEDLYAVIVPLIDPASMLPHDEPERFAAVNSRRAKGR